MRYNYLFFLFTMITVTVGISITACSNDDDTYSYDLSAEDLQLNEKENVVACFPFAYNGITPEVKPQLTSKASLPSWLVSKINIWEDDDPTESTAVYSGEWEGNDFYYVFCGLQQTILGELYNKDGSLLGGCFSFESEGSLENFLQTSSNWKLVYCTDVSKYIKIMK